MSAQEKPGVDQAPGSTWALAGELHDSLGPFWRPAAPESPAYARTLSIHVQSVALIFADFLEAVGHHGAAWRVRLDLLPLLEAEPAYPYRPGPAAYAVAALDYQANVAARSMGLPMPELVTLVHETRMKGATASEVEALLERARR